MSSTAVVLLLTRVGLLEQKNFTDRHWFRPDSFGRDYLQGQAVVGSM